VGFFALELDDRNPTKSLPAPTDAEAEAHIALADRLVAEQRERVLQLDRGGHDTGRARALLAQFEDIQRLHLAGREKIRAELTATALEAPAETPAGR
jgi:hypothetical protein